MVNYQSLDLQGLLNELSKASSGSTSGRDALDAIPSFVLVKTGEMVSQQLAGTSGAIGRSANSIKETLDHSTSTAKATLENSSKFFIDAIRVNTEKMSENGKRIEGQLDALTVALSQASGDIQSAGIQSAETAKTLNRFTSILAIGTMLLVFAACWQAFESHRQVNLINQQLEIMRTPPAPPLPAKTPSSK
jgi:hypothetical protein